VFEPNDSIKVDTWYFKRSWNWTFGDIQQVCSLFTDSSWFNRHHFKYENPCICTWRETKLEVCYC